MSTDDYDWDVHASTNSYESWRLGIQEIRLDRIRRGVLEPRPHRADEVAAWEQGQRVRTAIWAAIGGALCLLAGVAVITSETAPETKYGAATIGLK